MKTTRKKKTFNYCIRYSCVGFYDTYDNIQYINEQSKAIEKRSQSVEQNKNV